MSESEKPQFDHYAGKYQELHKSSIRASGEDPEYFAAYKANVMAAWLGPDVSRRPLRILDFGCGIGNSIPHIRRAFPLAEIYGADPSPESIRMASESLAGMASFSVIGGTRLPYQDHSFDAVLAACVFHHIQPAERNQWMVEIRRVLRPGGDSFVFEHNVLNPLTLKAVRDCPFDEDAILLPRSELMALAKNNGFTRPRSRYVVFFPRALSFLRPMEPALGWIPFGAQYLVHARS